MRPLTIVLAFLLVAACSGGDRRASGSSPAGREAGSGGGPSPAPRGAGTGVNGGDPSGGADGDASPEPTEEPEETGTPQQPAAAGTYTYDLSGVLGAKGPAAGEITLSYKEPGPAPKGNRLHQHVRTQTRLLNNTADPGWYRYVWRPSGQWMDRITTPNTGTCRLNKPVMLWPIPLSDGRTWSSEAFCDDGRKLRVGGRVDGRETLQVGGRPVETFKAVVEQRWYRAGRDQPDPAQPYMRWFSSDLRLMVRENQQAQSGDQKVEVDQMLRSTEPGAPTTEDPPEGF